MSSTTLKKLALGLVSLWLLLGALSWFVKYYIMKDIPPFLAHMMETLPANPALSAKVGEDATVACTYDNADSSTDTLRYSLSLRGLTGTMNLKGYATKRQGQWVPNKSDTLFTKN